MVASYGESSVGCTGTLVELRRVGRAQATLK